MTFLNLRIMFLLFVLPAVICITGCRAKARVLTSPPHYNFSEVYTDKLDLKLQEISGITWDSKNNIFYAINDELGKLFTLDKESKTINGEYAFGNKGDYEDVAILNEIPYILRSDGTVFKFVKDSTGKTYGEKAGKVPVSGSNDFESMYSDPARKALIVICKKCSGDDSKTVSAYAFYPDSTGFDEKPIYIIDATKVEELSPFSSSKFQPSAAAIHPRLQKLFIISATSHQIVVANLNGTVESVHKLSPKLFLQPEGITFKQNGDMYISNEGLGSKATLLKFSYMAPGDSLTGRKVKAGYEFDVPDEKMELGKHLKEISGMAYIPGKNLILAENDEKGNIFTLDFAKKNDNLGKEKFAGKGDYEDIVYTDKAIYMLISSGAIVEVITKDTTVTTREFDLGLKKSEFETMYLDADGQSLIILCKDCSKDKDEIRAAYRFDLKTKTFSTEPKYIISIADIQKFLNDDKAEFKPSAGGINPVDGKLYLVASVGKILVVTDTKGKIEQVFRLDPNLFNQPEGLTFAPNGDLYISNEGGEGTATILKFVYKK